jgi:hypothetical protein
MKKLNLDMNMLEVESFQTSHLSSWEGTVHGNDDATEGGDTKCGGIHTCGDGCGGLTAGGATKCAGIQTCGDGCGAITAGGATKCGGVETCGEGCNA